MDRAIFSAGVFARCHGPSELPAVCAASYAAMPRWQSSRYLVVPRFHWFQTIDRSRRRSHCSSLSSTSGVSHRPKYPIHPRRYSARSWTMRARLIPRVRLVSSRTRSLNRATAFGARRLFGCLWFEKLNPRNFRRHGRATALFSRLTRSLSFVVESRRVLIAPFIPLAGSVRAFTACAATTPSADPCHRIRGRSLAPQS